MTDAEIAQLLAKALVTPAEAQVTPPPADDDGWYTGSYHRGGLDDMKVDEVASLHGDTVVLSTGDEFYAMTFSAAKLRALFAAKGINL